VLNSLPGIAWSHQFADLKKMVEEEGGARGGKGQEKVKKKEKGQGQGQGQGQGKAASAPAPATAPATAFPAEAGV